MAKYRKTTPDRQITPDDDELKKPCINCNGKGQTIVWDGEDEEQTADYEDCTECGGTGEVPIEKWEEDW